MFMGPTAFQPTGSIYGTAVSRSSTGSDRPALELGANTPSQNPGGEATGQEVQA